MVRVLSVVALALILAGGPVAAMVCQTTCVSAVAADPHACCHHGTAASGQAITCASDVCDHADASQLATAPIVSRPTTTPAIVAVAVVSALGSRVATTPTCRSDYQSPQSASSSIPLRV